MTFVQFTFELSACVCVCVCVCMCVLACVCACVCACACVCVCQWAFWTVWGPAWGDRCVATPLRAFSSRSIWCCCTSGWPSFSTTSCRTRPSKYTDLALFHTSTRGARVRRAATTSMCCILWFLVHVGFERSQRLHLQKWKMIGENNNKKTKSDQTPLFFRLKSFDFRFDISHHSNFPKRIGLK